MRRLAVQGRAKLEGLGTLVDGILFRSGVDPHVNLAVRIEGGQRCRVVVRPRGTVPDLQRLRRVDRGGVVEQLKADVLALVAGQGEHGVTGGFVDGRAVHRQAAVVVQRRRIGRTGGVGRQPDASGTVVQDGRGAVDGLAGTWTGGAQDEGVHPLVLRVVDHGGAHQERTAGQRQVGAFGIRNPVGAVEVFQPRPEVFASVGLGGAGHQRGRARGERQPDHLADVAGHGEDGIGRALVDRDGVDRQRTVVVEVGRIAAVAGRVRGCGGVAGEIDAAAAVVDDRALTGVASAGAVGGDERERLAALAGGIVQDGRADEQHAARRNARGGAGIGGPGGAVEVLEIRLHVDVERGMPDAGSGAAQRERDLLPGRALNLEQQVW